MAATISVKVCAAPFVNVRRMVAVLPTTVPSTAVEFFIVFSESATDVSCPVSGTDPAVGEAGFGDEAGSGVRAGW